jgi:unsaturated chondroitin disaccharide hydrolase
VLKGGLYHLHKDLGVDESVMWGDYYFVEALEEALRIMRSHSSGAPVHAA